MIEVKINKFYSLKYNFHSCDISQGTLKENGVHFIEHKFSGLKIK